VRNVAIVRIVNGARTDGWIQGDTAADLGHPRAV
jgi:hypothetical protein